MTPIVNSEKVLIAEDHHLYRDGLKRLIEEMLPKAPVRLASDYPTALALLNQEPDITLLLLDIKLPGTNNLDGLQEIRCSFPTLTIVVVSSLDFKFSIRQMLDLGANGFIAKTTPKQDMMHAISDILRGEIVIKSENKGLDHYDLTQRQLETLGYMAQGLSNIDIAEKLGVSKLTAKEYVSKVISRLNAENRTQAVLIAQKSGLVIDHF